MDGQSMVTTREQRKRKTDSAQHGGSPAKSHQQSGPPAKHSYPNTRQAWRTGRESSGSIRQGFTKAPDEPWRNAFSGSAGHSTRQAGGTGRESSGSVRQDFTQSPDGSGPNEPPPRDPAGVGIRYNANKAYAKVRRELMTENTFRDKFGRYGVVKVVGTITATITMEDEDKCATAICQLNGSSYRRSTMSVRQYEMNHPHPISAAGNRDGGKKVFAKVRGESATENSFRVIFSAYGDVVNVDADITAVITMETADQCAKAICELNDSPYGRSTMFVRQYEINPPRPN